MANNVLTGVVQITAPGVQQTFNNVATSAAKAEQGLKKLAPASNSANLALINTGRVVQDLPYGFLGIANNLNPLLESFQRLKAESGSTSTALKSIGSSLLGPGGIGFALSLVTTGVLLLTNGFQSFSRKTNDAKETADAFAESIKNISKQTAEEAARVEALVVFLQRGTASTMERNAAIKELQSISPAYFGLLSKEKFTIDQLTSAYNSYVGSLRRSVEAKVIEKQLSAAIEKRLDLEKKLGIGASITSLVRVNGQLVRQYNAIYTTSEDLLENQKELNNAKLEEQDLANRLALIKPASLKLDTREIKVTPDYQKFGADMISLATKIKSVPFFGAFENNAFASFDENVKNATALVQAFYKTVGDPQKSNIKFDLPVTKIGATLPGIDPTKTYKDILTIPIKFKLEPLSQEMIKQLQGIADLISGVVEPAFGQLFDTILAGKDAFAAFGQFVKQIIVEMIKQLIQAEIRALILKIVLSAGSGVGALSAAAAAAGAAAGVAGGRAIGGPVNAGESYIVGEKGPEIFKPNTGGSIIPNHQIMSSGSMVAGGMAVRVTGEFIQRGQDLLAVISVANQSKLRTQ